MKKIYQKKLRNDNSRKQIKKLENYGTIGIHHANAQEFKKNVRCKSDRKSQVVQ